MKQSRMNFIIRSYGLYLAWIVSIISLFGSLFFSEIMHFEPCRLCWYQRICMYPLAVQLGIACYRNDMQFIPYARTLSIIGGCISLFHYLEQKVSWLHTVVPCTTGVPCNGQYINWLGFITIPLLALIAFTLITILLTATKGLSK